MKHRTPHLFEGLSRNIVLLGIVSLFTDLSSQMVFPLIPLYLTVSLGAGAYAVGLVEGAAEATASLLKVLSGYWSDRLRKRKPFVLLGYSLSTVTKPLFAVASLWGLVLFIRVIERIGKGLRTAPRDAIVAESCDECVRGKAFGYNRAADGIGSTGGALLAFWLITFLDYEDIFLLAFIPGLIAVAAILPVKDPPHPTPHTSGNKSLRISLRALPMNLRIFILISAIFALGHFGYAFLILKAKAVGLSDSNTLLLYTIFYIVYTLIAIPAGALSDHIGRKPILLAGYILFGITALGLAFTPNVYWLFPFFALYGIFFAFIDGAQRAFVVDLAPAHLRATALGTFHTAIGLVALPGGFLAGFLWDTVSPEATFVYGLCLATLSVLLMKFVSTPAPFTSRK